MRYLLAAGVIVVLLLFAFLISRTSHTPTLTMRPYPTSNVVPTVIPSLIVGTPAPNTLVANEAFTDTAISFTHVTIQKPGFVVVREYKNKKEGSIVAVSDLLLPNDYTDMSIQTKRSVHDGDFLKAELVEDNGDKIYSTKDTRVLERDDQSPVSITFRLEKEDSQ